MAFYVKGPDASCQDKSRSRFSRLAELSAEWCTLLVKWPIRLRSDLLQFAFDTDLNFWWRCHLDQDAIGLFRDSNPRSGLRVGTQDQSCRPCEAETSYNKNFEVYSTILFS